ncbi:hypothetical protein [Pyrococcus kukulkanii]|uniref:hypothetical protein n=1 Tax=Pyrococcus kukulkanii TaxID=1609559 RepID=UPI00356490DD
MDKKLELIADIIVGKHLKKVPFLGIPYTIVLLMLPSSILGPWRAYKVLGIHDFVYLLIGPITSFFGVIIMYPVVERILSQEYLNEVILTLDSVLSESRETIREIMERSLDKNFLNKITFILAVSLYFIWVFKGFPDTLLMLFTITAMIVWVPAISATLYVLKLGKTIVTALGGNYEKFGLSKTIEMIITGKNPIRDFVKFKHKLERIFVPYITLVLRLMMISFVVEIGAYIVRIRGQTLGFPRNELESFLYSANLVFIGSFLVLLFLVYLIVKLSLELKDAFLVEIKAIKVKNNSQTSLIVLEEIEDIVKDSTFILLSPQQLLEIMAIIITALSIVLTIMS